MLLLAFTRISASCTHVSTLLHALAAMSPTEQFPHMSTDDDDTENDLPCTSYPCQWKKPWSRKETNLKISNAKVQKHALVCQSKTKRSPTNETFWSTTL